MRRKSRIPSEEKCVKILLEEGVTSSVLRHVLKVNEVAKDLADRVESKGYRVNKKLVAAGALLHDIGRAVTHDVSHGVIGGQIVRRRKLGERLARIVERHVGAGISEEEAERLKLGSISLIPETIEEKIVCYADKLVDGDKKVEFTETLKYFKEKLGADHPAIRRLEELDQFFQEILRKNNEGRKPENHQP
ncbi:HDIG domain-containing protein [Candidatus Bathyarchaeota archaeon]|nr:HDIG domain-containing protein [Candidatus Bathyarchaeota archaeon]